MKELLKKYWKNPEKLIQELIRELWKETTPDRMANEEWMRQNGRL